MDAHIVIALSGGVGKQICFTSLLPLIKERYSHVHITSGYEDIFIGNPYVSSINNIDHLGGYSFLKKDNVNITIQDPYDHPCFLKKECHLIDAWADFIFKEDSLNIDKEKRRPLLYLTDKDLYNSDILLNQLKQETNNKIILFQFHGGQSPFHYDENPGGPFEYYNEELKRFYPFDYYIALIKKLKETYPNHTLVRYGLPNEYVPSEVQHMVFNLPTIPFKQYKAICESVDAIVSIDSSLQHIAAASNLKRPAVVVWGETAPEHQGYPFHINLREEQPQDTQAYCRPFGHPNDNVVFPHPDKVMQALQDVGMSPEEPETKEEVSDSHDCNNCQCNAG